MRILLVDDHAVVRHGLRRLLAPDGEHTFAEAVDGHEAIAVARDYRPHIIILDLNLPGLGGLELVRRLVKAGHGRVLVLSMLAAPQYARRALEAGAHGYLSKNAPPEELLSAVGRVGQGLRYVEAAIAQALALDETDAAEGFEALSLREIEILRLLGQGASLAKIGEALGVSYKTVANNCVILRAKLHVARTVDLVRLAMDSGFAPSLGQAPAGTGEP